MNYVVSAVVMKPPEGNSCFWSPSWMQATVRGQYSSSETHCQKSTKFDQVYLIVTFINKQQVIYIVFNIWYHVNDTNWLQ